MANWSIVIICSVLSVLATFNVAVAMRDKREREWLSRQYLAQAETIEKIIQLIKGENK